MTSKYKFGKWMVREGDFIGRHIRQLEECVLMEQENDI